jgi:hypothetical protein
MKHPTKTLGAVASVALGLLCSGIYLPAETAPSPQAVTKTFYQWYLHALARNEEPLLKHKSDLKKFVTERLLNELERRMKSSEGASIDYFLQAQDWLEDWESNVATTETITKSTTATTTVILGARPDSRHEMVVNLRLESGLWKIARVISLRPPEK